MTTATRSTDSTPSPTLPTEAFAASHRNLVFTRIIDATPEVVFQAWIKPAHLAKWWGPKGFTNPVCEVDTRPGGAILIHMCSPNGEVFPMKGTFHEIIENQRIVMKTSAFEDENGNAQLEDTKIISFEAFDGKTKLTVQDVVTKATPQLAASLDGMEEGWNQSVDRLEDLVTTAARKKTHIVAEPNKPTIIISRTFNAPRHLVFKAWTQPEHVKRWWGCNASTLIICEIDLRVGGAYRYVMQVPDGSQHPFKGIYREVVAPERLAHTQIYDVEPYSAIETVVTIVFDEQDGKTTMTETILHPSVESRDGHIASGMELGVSESLNSLEDLLSQI